MQEEIDAKDRANAILTQATKKAQQRIRLGISVLFISIVGAGLAWLSSLQASHKKKIAEEVTKLEQLGASALRQFEFRQIEGLVLAMEAGQRLQKLAKNGDAPTLTPIIALQRILDNIQERNKLRAHYTSSRISNYSKDGKYLATASLDGGAKVWNNKGQELFNFIKQGVSVLDISISPNDKYIAAVLEDEDFTVHVWTQKGKLQNNWKLEHNFPSHKKIVENIIFSPNSKLIATASRDNTAKLWDLQGNPIETFLHGDEVTSVSFHPEGQYLATSSFDGTAKLWNLKGELIQVLPHDDKVTDVEFSPDGKYMATSSLDLKVILWELQAEQIQGELQVEQIREYEGHLAYISDLKFSHDSHDSKSKLLASSSSDGTVRLWDLEVNEKESVLIFKHSSPSLQISFSRPDDKVLVTCTEEGYIHSWDTQESRLPILKHNKKWVRDAEFSPDGQRIVTVSNDEIACLWDLEGNLLKKFEGHEQEIYDVSFHPDGQHVASSSADGKILIWNSLEEIIRKLEGTSRGANVIDFSPDGQMIAIPKNQYVELWDWNNKDNRKHAFRFLAAKDKKKVTQVLFSPNGKFLATKNTNSKNITVWDLKGNLISELKSPDIVLRYRFSPDSKKIATSSFDYITRLWTIEGELLRTFKEHRGVVTDVSFHRDGQVIATSSTDGTIRLWDLKGNQIGEFRGHKAVIQTVNFSPEGKLLVTASQDGTARLWKIETLDELLARGCDWLADYLVAHPKEAEKLEVCKTQTKDDN